LEEIGDLNPCHMHGFPWFQLLLVWTLYLQDASHHTIPHPTPTSSPKNRGKKRKKDGNYKATRATIVACIH